MGVEWNARTKAAASTLLGSNLANDIGASTSPGPDDLCHGRGHPLILRFAFFLGARSSSELTQGSASVQVAGRRNFKIPAAPEERRGPELCFSGSLTLMVPRE